MSKKPLILITNDDGINSEGIAMVASSVASLGDIAIVAPNIQQTSAARSQPLNDDTGIIEETLVVLPDGKKEKGYAVHGSPSFCTIFGIANVIKRKPDLLISGINLGLNVGSNVTISGTIGAALEANCLGVPSIAISVETDLESIYSHDGHKADFSLAGKVCTIWAKRVLDYTFYHKIPEGIKDMEPDWLKFININVPLDCKNEFDYEWTCLDSQGYYSYLGLEGRDVTKPFSRQVTTVINKDTMKENGDICALFIKKKISVTPLSADLTRTNGSGF